MNKQVPDHVRQYIVSHKTLTLATSLDNRPWATSLFYVSDSELNLYFISDPATLHIEQALENNNVALTITAEDQAWHEIQGLQISGRLAMVGPDDTARVENLYCEKFPFLKKILAPATNNEEQKLIDKYRASNFYSIKPDFVRLIDNTRGFGFKEEFIISSPQQ